MSPFLPQTNFKVKLRQRTPPASPDTPPQGGGETRRSRMPLRPRGLRGFTRIPPPPDLSFRSSLGAKEDGAGILRSRVARLRGKSLAASVLLLAAILPNIAAWQQGGDIDSYPFYILEAHAQGPGSSNLEATAQKFFTKALEVFVVLNWFALMAVQTLLDIDTIFGQPLAGVRPMEQILNPLWVLSRDIVNAIFAFMLLIGGAYLIVSGEGVESFIKQRMPKFVLAVILVNFSWFFPRVIIDAAHVLSAIIYQIPLLVTRDASGNLFCVGGPGPDRVIDTPFGGPLAGDDEPCKYVYRVVLFPTQRKECEDDGDPTTPLPTDCAPPTPPNGMRIGDFVDIYYVDWKTFVTSGHEWTDDTVSPSVTYPVYPSGADAIINGLAVNFAKIPNFAVIDFENLVIGDPDEPTAIRAAGFAQFFIHLILHVILSIAVGLALLAFMVVLIVRMGVLWLCIAFMPFIFVGYAWGKGLGELGEEAGGINIWKKFIAYAFLPAFVAIPFAVGFTLISQLYYVQAAFPRVVHLQNLNIMQEINDFHHILWMVITVMIIWKGVFAVLESKDDFAKGIVGAIKGIGTAGVRFATQTIGYAPVIPTPSGVPTSVLGLRDQFADMTYRRGGPWFRGGAPPPGGPTVPPPSEAHVTQATQQMTKEQFRELKNILGGTNATNAQEQQRKFGETLSRFSQSAPREHRLTPEQAQAAALSPEAMRALAREASKQGVDISGEIATAQQHFRGVAAAPAQVTFGDSNFTMNVQEVRRESKPENIIAKIKESLKEIPTMKRTDVEDGLRKLQDAVPTAQQKQQFEAMRRIMDIEATLRSQGKTVTKPEDIRGHIPRELQELLGDSGIRELVDLMVEANKREAAKPKGTV